MSPNIEPVSVETWDTKPHNGSSDNNIRPVGSTATGSVMPDSHSIKKTIGPITMISVCFNICNSWAGITSSTQIALIQGGPVTLVFGIIFAAVLYMAIALSMGELASVYPTAGGQYHFASVLAPKRGNREISYICGVLTMFSWVAIGSSVSMASSQQILPLAEYYNPGYVAKDWHYFLVYQAFLLVVLVYNMVALKKLPVTHNIGFFVTLSLFLISLIFYTVRASPKATSEFVWNTFLNLTGWPDGVCFFAAQLTTCFCFAGLDGALHLAEDAPNPRTAVPRATVTTVLIGFTTAFSIAICILYSISDFESLLTIDGYVPFEIMRQAFRSNNMAVGILIASCFLSFFILNAVVETSSRIAWALAKDNALLMSSKLELVHPGLEIPTWSLIFSWFFIALTGVVFVISSTAFNAVLASLIVLQLLSFSIPCALLLYQRRSEEYLPADRLFRLPHWLGFTVNAYVVGISLMLTVFFVLPTFLPVTASTMNYTVVILAIVALLSTINWFLHAGRAYQGPRIEYNY
ncbi:choline transport protein, putative [Talaromyces stipitatus ATCC 10500]|uniref:Choline transport protein, putative n=1 Tax=Talaromyces stipitatus (strain ATCC 10500 / CBS 375.48 / QM 6759 / NRRL 1006) TaxID=441959 RepID=B8M1G3_TALSN|nr:choline transport protein, putative [Talaromyces stipitatus ATCC 10500]EED21859.1 choline transport protein, putative [Talaromyces stipitatus ATCC 10500]